MIYKGFLVAIVVLVCVLTPIAFIEDRLYFKKSHELQALERGLPVVTVTPWVHGPEKCDDTTIICNCYLYVKNKIPGLPMTKDLYAKVPPTLGSVALFTYPSGLRHYAVVESLQGETFTISECNFKRGTCGLRDVSYDDPALDGFWTP